MRMNFAEEDRTTFVEVVVRVVCGGKKKHGSKSRTCFFSLVFIYPLVSNTTATGLSILPLTPPPQTPH